MFSKPSPDALQRLRTLLERLEQTADPCLDADTIESMKTLVRHHIAAIEAVQAVASDPPETPLNKKP
jgi:predicted component of type VI protein secretion system